MEDFYEKYIKKEVIIDKACDCVNAHSSQKLKEEIEQIKSFISSISIQDKWQDSVGDAISKIVTSCVDVLNTIENSIESSFYVSEKTYILLQTKLKKLKETNKLYRDLYQKEPHRSSFKKQETIVTENVPTTRYVTDDSAYNNAYNDWKNKLKMLKEKCEMLSLEIDKSFATLKTINDSSISDNMADNIELPYVSLNIFNNITDTIGKFIANIVSGKYGSIVSSIDGKEHTIYNQVQLGWPNDCNRAAFASIVSALVDDPMKLIDELKKCKDGLGYISDVTNDTLSKYGLHASVNKIDGSYDTVKGDIVSALKSGKMVMFDLSEPNVYGESGQKWTGTRHWLAVLDIKKTGPGENDYAIFVSDSGHNGSTKDYYGLGEGWYPISEFNGKKIANVTTISQANKLSEQNTQVGIASAASAAASSVVPSSIKTYSNIDSTSTVSGTDTEAIVYSVLKDHGYNEAAISGIMGNMEHESGFDTNATGDNGHSHGICQWNETKNAGYRWTKAQQWMDEHGYDYNSPEGQAEFMVYELENDYSKVNDTLKNVDNSSEGAKKAARVFSLRYEMPAAKDRAANARASSTSKYFDNYSSM